MRAALGIFLLVLSMTAFAESRKKNGLATIDVSGKDGIHAEHGDSWEGSTASSLTSGADGGDAKPATPPENAGKIDIVVEQMENPDETLRKQRVLRRVIYGLGSTGLLVVFLFAMNGKLHPFTAALAAGMAGAFIGFALMLDFLRKQWPVTRQHVNLDSVKRRLQDLDFPESG